MIYCYFLAVWILTPSAVAVQSTQYVLLGETVNFRTNITDPPDDILWKHNGNKVVQFDGNQQTEYNPFQKRIILYWNAADLEIHHLTHSDSGQYELDAAKGSGVIRINFELKVLDRVSKPTITCNMRDGSSSNKSGSEATLMCSTNTPQSLNYEWSQPGKIQSGQILTIPLGTEHDDKVYSCTASNQLSKEIATFTAKDCYPVGTSGGLIIGLIIGLIVLLLFVLGAVLCTLKHKGYFAKDKEKDENEKNRPHGEKNKLLHSNPKKSGSEEETDEEAHLATKTSSSPDDVREEDESPTTPTQTVNDKVKKFEQRAEKNKDGPRVVTRNPSFLNDKGRLDKKVKSGQLEEHTEATQPGLQTQIPSKGPESEKMGDEEAKFADESSTQIIPHKPPAEEQKQDVISDQDTEKTIEETEKEKEEKKSDGMREKGELPTSSGQTGSEEKTDEEAHPATETSSSPDDVREEDESPTTAPQTVKDKVKKFEQ